jgi:hypothetical protein
MVAIGASRTKSGSFRSMSLRSSSASGSRPADPGASRATDWAEGPPAVPQVAARRERFTATTLTGPGPSANLTAINAVWPATPGADVAGRDRSCLLRRSGPTPEADPLGSLADDAHDQPCQVSRPVAPKCSLPEHSRATGTRRPHSAQRGPRPPGRSTIPLLADQRPLGLAEPSQLGRGYPRHLELEVQVAGVWVLQDERMAATLKLGHVDDESPELLLGLPLT